MEFDQGWILLGLPIAFALGWLASRFDLRQLKLDNQRTPKAYFKGLNHLLNEQQDQAIDAFIEAVQSDPDTSELHFALGNLFRRRGEYERAVRVHQHLLARADLVMTPDSGPAQMANAMGSKVLGLYACTDATRSGPYSDLRYTVNRYPDAAIRFLDKPAAALSWGKRVEFPGVMDLIEVADVIARFERYCADQGGPQGFR